MEISRWLASEANVTTGDSSPKILAPRSGCRDSGTHTRGLRRHAA